jgi:hypothetical protein
MHAVRKLLAALVVLTFPLALLPMGCLAEDASLIVRGVLIATPTGDTTAGTVVCNVPLADPMAQQVPLGAIDTGIATEYRAPILLMSQIISQVNAAKQRPETSLVSLTTADVRLEDSEGNQIVRSNGSDAAFSTPISGFVPPQMGGAPGYGTAVALFVDSATVKDLAKTLKASGKTMTLVAKMVVHGKTTGGQELSSPEFAFPIEASYGGLVSCATGPGCLPGAAVPLPSCRVGLDVPTDCRLCPGREVCACNGD